MQGSLDIIRYTKKEYAVKALLSDLLMYLSLIAFYLLSAAALLLRVLDYGKD